MRKEGKRRFTEQGCIKIQHLSYAKFLTIFSEIVLHFIGRNLSSFHQPLTINPQPLSSSHRIILGLVDQLILSAISFDTNLVLLRSDTKSVSGSVGQSVWDLVLTFILVLFLNLYLVMFEKNLKYKKNPLFFTKSP